MKRTLIVLGTLSFLVVGPVSGEEELLSRSLSLESCVRRAILENPDLKSEQINMLIGEEEIRNELAAFAWNLEASSLYEHRGKPQNAREASANSIIGGIDRGNRVFWEDNWRSRVGFTKRFTSGTKLELGTRHSVSENDLSRGSAYSSFSTEHEMFLGVTLTQPLLRGFGKRSTLAATDIAKLKAESARMLTLIKATNLVAEVAARYVDVVATQKVLETKSQNIERALKLVERNQKLLDTGKGVENDLTTAELAVEQRRDDYLRTEVELVQYLNALAGLINLGPEWSGAARLNAVSGFGLEGNLPLKQEVTDAALKKRVDLDYYRTVIESAQVNIRRARDGAKPSLNLVGSAGLYGLDGSTSDAMERAVENQGGEVSVGLEFRMELGGESGRSAVEIAKHQLTQAELGYGQARSKIALEVDTAYRRVLNARERVQTAHKVRQLARKNLEEEERLLEQSKGDLYRVVERQQQLGDADARVVASRSLLSKAVVGLWLASGQLFERYEISEQWLDAVIEDSETKKAK